MLAVKVTATPAGDGAGRDVVMLFKISVPPVDDEAGGGSDDVLGEVVEDVELDEIGNAMLPLAAALSYASAELPALRIHTATRYKLLAVVGVHVQVLLVDQSRRTTQFAPSYVQNLYW
jgi:hypothetical protein